jgi:hypothetical protein
MVDMLQRISIDGTDNLKNIPHNKITPAREERIIRRMQVHSPLCGNELDSVT